MNRDPEVHAISLIAARAIVAVPARYRALIVCAGLALFVAGPAAMARDAEVQAPEKTVAADNFPDYATVEELLRLDAQAALLAARRAVTNPLDEQHRPARQAPQGNALLAIFGTDRALNAEVQIGSRIYTYRTAMRRAVAGGSSPYLLEKIDPPCVHLTQGQQKEVLCLSRAQP